MMTSRSVSPWDLRGLFEGFPCNTAVPAMQVEGICSDSRSVQHGDVFFAIPGITSNGIDFVTPALEAGAVAVVYDATDAYSLERVRLLQKQVQTLWLGVECLAMRAGEIASRFYGYPSREMTMIGVTGTDGKTSVTHLLVQALGRLGKRTASIGTLGSGVDNQFSGTSLTTPMAFDVQQQLAEFRQQGCQAVVMEVSSHALHQYRVGGCEFNLGVFTNLGRDHLDYHQTMEDYASAKARLFTDFPIDFSILNIDDVFGQQLLERHSANQALTFSASGNAGATVQLAEARLLPDGMKLSVMVDGKQFQISNQLIGQFNIDNLLACFACLLALDVDPESIASALSDLHAIPGRMESFSSTSSKAHAVVDFAHTDQALKACLTASRAHCEGSLWCVFGAGGDRDPGKRPLMGRVVEQLADRVVVTNDNPRSEAPQSIANDILGGMKDAAAVELIFDRESAIRYALDNAGPGDLVVIAGKGHEQEQIIGDQRLPFSDRDLVSRLLGVTHD